MSRSAKVIQQQCYRQQVVYSTSNCLLVRFARHILPPQVGKMSPPAMHIPPISASPCYRRGIVQIEQTWQLRALLDFKHRDPFPKGKTYRTQLHRPTEMLPVWLTRLLPQPGSRLVGAVRTSPRRSQRRPRVNAIVALSNFARQWMLGHRMRRNMIWADVAWRLCWLNRAGP